MNRHFRIYNAILWAIAIIVSALLKAPNELTLLALPTLSISALMLADRAVAAQKPCSAATGADHDPQHDA
ncbi:MAG TPA: hypothetical protein VHE37_13665 [Nevskiaceae bacterium]|nr:hypothetical protein [Nevskiaceae bacterium]